MLCFTILSYVSAGHIHVACLLLIHALNASGSYCRQADKIQMDFEIFKILYRLNYFDFYFVYYHCNLIVVLEIAFQLTFVK